MPINIYDSNECTNVQAVNDWGASCFGGAARRLSFLNAFRSQNNSSFVVDLGGAFAGSTLTSLFGTAPMAHAMGRAGYAILATCCVCVRICVFFSFFFAGMNVCIMFYACMFACLCVQYARFSKSLTMSFPRRWLPLHRYDVVGFSEGDFFQGPAVLGAYLDTFASTSPNTVFVLSNVDVSREPSLLRNGIPKFVPYTVFSRGGAKVAFLCTVPSDLATRSSSGPTVVVNRGGNATTAQIVAATVRDINTLHPDISLIVWLTGDYIGVADQVAVQGLGVQVVLSPLYYDTSTSRTTVPQNPQVRSTVLSTPLSPDFFASAGIVLRRGSSVGTVALTMSAPRVLLSSSVTGGLVRLSNTSVTPNMGVPSEWTTALNLYEQAIPLLNLAVSYTNVSIDGSFGTNLTVGNEGCLFTDCQMGRLVTDAYLSWCPTCDVAIINAGGLFGSFTTGNISRGQVLAALPFGDNLVSFSVRGLSIANALSVMAAAGLGKTAFLQVAGMRFAWNPSTKTILQAEVWDKALQSYSRLRLQGQYRVVTSDFLFFGGDGCATC
jgi:2',3'-cyclic-nucleotide 2'-phosphodiesterase (5'-nucleotidase family)